MAAATAHTADFTDHLKFRCPPALKAMVQQAADREMTTRAEYLRRAALQQLRADGIAPPQPSAAVA
jgi:hypothetical protein